MPRQPKKRKQPETVTGNVVGILFPEGKSRVCPTCAIPKIDDEVCICGHSKAYHTATALDSHGGHCEKCSCTLYTWGKFVRYVDAMEK